MISQKVTGERYVYQLFVSPCISVGEWQFLLGINNTDGVIAKEHYEYMYIQLLFQITMWIFISKVHVVWI